MIVFKYFAFSFMRFFFGVGAGGIEGFVDFVRVVNVEEAAAF